MVKLSKPLALLLVENVQDIEDEVRPERGEQEF
jgi:hypothetical protein